MTQSIVVQVGQCGNQIGCRFWDLALREHATVNKDGTYDESLSSFFRNVDSRSDDPANIPLDGGTGKIKALKARAVLVDMEEGVVSEMMKGPLREVFDFKQLLTDVSGAGNNWAVGHKMYGSQYREQLSDIIRRAAEFCDCLQCFFIIHSMGGGLSGSTLFNITFKDEFLTKSSDTNKNVTAGLNLLLSLFGTGSGVGTFILNLLEEEYPDIYSVQQRSRSDGMELPASLDLHWSQLLFDIYQSGIEGQSLRFVTAVYPSVDDDVITSPYNSVLAMRELTEKADCVLPIENQALMSLVNKINAAIPPSKTGKRTYSSVGGDVKAGSAITASDGSIVKPANEKPFDSMNNIVANLLLNMTSSARFEGSLNVDLNEITMNLVPFPRLHYLVSSQSPLFTLSDVSLPPRRLDQMFSDAFSKDYQLLKTDPKHSLYLACALMVRGNVEVSDVRRNIERLKPNLKFIHWNTEGWKTGLCSVAPVGQSYSLLTLANNTCIHNNFTELKDRFVKLYKRKAHIHHYTHVDGMELSDFSQSLESLNSIIQEYSSLEKQMLNPPAPEPRLQVMT